MNCNSCHRYFADFQELALHIQHSKTGHRKGKIWAARFLTRVNQLDRKVDNKFEGRTPLTEEQKDTKRELVRELSGETKLVLCVCPHCKKGHEERIEVEHLESPFAWRSPAGNPMILHTYCRGSRSN